MSRTAAAVQGLQALTVSSNGEWLAIDAADVAEVVRQPAMTRVPLSPASLVGVCNLRGNVVPILSLAALRGQRQGDAGAGKVVIIDQGSPVGLLVDEVSSLTRAIDLRTGSGAMPFLDFDALVAPQFGALARPKAAASYAQAGASQEAVAVEETRLAFFGFSIAGQEFALPLNDVREVLAMPGSLSLVPHTDKEMLGVIPLRDHLLPLVSLPALLGLSEVNSTANRRIVVARVGEADVGLVVDGVTSIIRAAPQEIDPVPMVLTRGSQEAQIQGICRLDGGKRLVSILSTDHLLKDGLAEQLLGDQKGEADLMTQASTGETEQILVFQIGEEDFGLPVASIAEVVAPPEKLTRLPKAPAFVEGVMNLRGEVVPVIDQRRRFEAASDARLRKPRVIVLQVGNGLAGFIVDAVTEVLAVPADQVRTSPQMASSQSKVIERIANLDGDGRMILLINPQELLDRAEQDILAAMQEAASAPA